MRWWEDLPTTFVCFHPYADRYLIDAWVEKCRECGEMRFTDQPKIASAEFWPPKSQSPRFGGGLSRLDG